MNKILVYIYLSLQINILNAQVCDVHRVFITQEGQCNNSPFVLVFEDNFDGDTLDLSKWQIQQWAQGSTQGAPSRGYLSLDNAIVNDGLLYIIGKNDTVVRRTVFWKPDTVILDDGIQNLRTFYYTSSCLWSKEKFRYGVFEVCCKIPKGKGFWPAFWTFGGPGWNEIDVFEFHNQENIQGNFDADKSTQSHLMNSHYDYDGDGKSENCSSKYRGDDFSESFHVFKVIYTPYKIEWYVDGEFKRRSTLYYTNLLQEVDCKGIKPMSDYLINKAFPRDSMAIIISFGFQSEENSPDDSSPFPSALEVDYIKHYAQTFDINEGLSEISFQIFPNPNYGEFNVEIDNDNIGWFDLLVLDYQGKIVHSINNISENQISININEENRGIYFLVLYVYHDNKFYSEKFYKR